MNTPDYFNTCATSGSGVDPYSSYRGNQAPHSSNGYAGIFVYRKNSNNPPSFRSEYLYQVLNTALTSGTEYYIEFWVSLGDLSANRVKHLGMYLTDDAGDLTPVNPSTADGLYDLTPQIPNTYPASSYYSNKTGWTKISGFFTPTTSGVKHIVIGNFDPGIPSGNASIQANPGGSVPNGESYYYIDDVVVTPASNCSYFGAPAAAGTIYSGDNLPVCPNGFFQFYVNPIPGVRKPNNGYEWKVTPSSAATIVNNGYSDVTIIPNQTGSFDLAVRGLNDCGTGPFRSRMVVVEDCNGPFSISPNPAISELVVELQNDSASSLSGMNQENEETFDVELFDAEQRSVARATSKEKIVILDVRQLSRGMYYLNIRYREAILQKQIMIEN